MCVCVLVGCLHSTVMLVEVHVLLAACLQYSTTVMLTCGHRTYRFQPGCLVSKDLVPASCEFVFAEHSMRGMELRAALQ